MKLFVLLFFITAFILLQESLFTRLWAKNLSLNLSFEDHILREGSKTSLMEIVTNQKFLPLPILHVKFRISKSFHFAASNSANITDYYYRNDIFSVSSKEKLVRKLHFICTERGYFTISDLTYSTKDYLLISSFVCRKKMLDYLYVTPKKFTPKDIPVQVMGLIGTTMSEKTLFEDPFEFKGIRQYQPYDSYRKINWKATARQQNIQVNTFFSTFSCEVFFVMNLTPKTLPEEQYLLEKSISILSTLASEFLHKKVPSGFVTNALDVENKRFLSIMPGVGMQHEINIDMKLARIDLKQYCESMTDCYHCIPDKEYTQIIYISPATDISAIQAFKELMKRSDNVTWVHPYRPDHLDLIPADSGIQKKQIINWEVNEHEKSEGN